MIAENIFYEFAANNVQGNVNNNKFKAFNKLTC